MIAKTYSELYHDALLIPDDEWCEEENGYIIRKERHLRNIRNNFKRDLIYKFDCNGDLRLEEKASDAFDSCEEIAKLLFPDNISKQFAHTEVVFEIFIKYI